MDLAVRAQLDQAVTLLTGRRAPGPHGALGSDVEHVEGLTRADGDRPGDGLDVQDVTGPAVVGRSADPQPLALPDGEPVRAAVRAELCSVLRHDAAAAAAQPA